ncbi:hypothetical protein C494_06830 [Natronorubrum bangense JCM 10635]|uniref:DUF2971 domain-containing protein n=1 Tax=Natronorubrum bangense JCM 10635 TaxID=1227500 RepID=L9WJS3_9EURY|nr:hypothetical protein C494_06830 [Natronorubrum bangense JCM 10635]
MTVSGDSDDRTFSFNNWKPKSPAIDKDVWRYRCLEHYTSILDQQCLWFSRPDQFDDPFEGSLPRKNIEERRDKYSSFVKKDRSAFRYIYRFVTYLNCWYSEEHESDAMWRLYSDEGNALAIKSTPSKIEESINAPDELIFGEVDYRNYDTFKIETENPIAPLFYKRNAFEFEKEFRLLTHYHSSDLPGSMSGEIKEIQPEGIPVPVDVEKMIEEVIISPTSSEEFINNVESITEEYGYDITINSSDLLNKEYAFF